MKHLESDSPNDESESDEDSDFEDVKDVGKHDDVEIDKIISDMTEGYRLTYKQIKRDPRFKEYPLDKLKTKISWQRRSILKAEALEKVKASIPHVIAQNVKKRHFSSTGLTDAEFKASKR